MSAIRNALRHRATVYRQGVTAWSPVLAAVPCLLDTGTAHEAEFSDSVKQRPRGRVGKLFTLPFVDIHPGDRVVMTRGSSGTFVINPNPALVGVLTEHHHYEFSVSEVTPA